MFGIKTKKDQIISDLYIQNERLKYKVTPCQMITDYWEVIDPSKIRQFAWGYPFYFQDNQKIEKSQRSSQTEEEYLAIIKKAIPLFEAYQKSGLHTVPERYLYDSLSEEDKAKYTYFDWQQIGDYYFGNSHVAVAKMLDGTYSIGYNGRHRLYIAKKYHIPIIVHVVSEEAYFPSKKWEDAGYAFCMPNDK